MLLWTAVVKTEMTVFCSAQCGDADASEGQGSHTGVCVGELVRFWNPGPLTPQPRLLFVTLLYSQLVMGHLTNI